LTRVEKSIEIKAPPGRVWEMLALDRQTGWMGEWKSAEYTSEVRTPEDKYRVGASAHVTEKHGEFDLEITESLENEKLTARSKGMAETMTLTFLLKPVEGGTKLTSLGDYEMPWGILGKALWGIYSRTVEKQVERASEKLKTILEK